MAEKIADRVSITICGDGGCGTIPRPAYAVHTLGVWGLTHYRKILYYFKTGQITVDIRVCGALQFQMYNS